MSTKSKDVITSWERDPNQWFTQGELKILQEKNIVLQELNSII